MRICSFSNRLNSSSISNFIHPRTLLSRRQLKATTDRLNWINGKNKMALQTRWIELRFNGAQDYSWVKVVTVGSMTLNPEKGEVYEGRKGRTC